MQTLKLIKISIALSALIIWVFSFLIIPETQAQADGWSGIEKLTPNSIDSIQSAVAVDSKGVSHVVYTATDFGGFSRIVYTNNLGGNWNSPVWISDGSNNIKDPHIAVRTVKGSVRVAIAYGGRNLFLKESPDGGQTWGQEIAITNHTALYPAVAIDSDGVKHIAYVWGKDADRNDTRMYYTSGNNGGWSRPSKIWDSPFQLHSETSMVIDSSDRLHLAFRFQRRLNGSNSEDEIGIMYGSSTGSGWGLSEISKQEAGKPHLAIDNDRLYLTYAKKDRGTDLDFETYLRTSSGSGWSEEQIIGLNDANLTYETAVACYQGNCGAITDDGFRQPRVRDVFTRNSSDGGSTWTESALLAGGPKISIDPYATAGIGGIRVTWTDNAEGKFRIYSAHYPLGFPKVNGVDLSQFSR